MYEAYLKYKDRLKQKITSTIESIIKKYDKFIDDVSISVTVKDGYIQVIYVYDDKPDQSLQDKIISEVADSIKDLIDVTGFNQGNYYQNEYSVVYIKMKPYWEDTIADVNNKVEVIKVDAYSAATEMFNSL